MNLYFSSLLLNFFLILILQYPFCTNAKKYYPSYRIKQSQYYNNEQEEESSHYGSSSSYVDWNNNNYHQQHHYRTQHPRPPPAAHQIKVPVYPKVYYNNKPYNYNNYKRDDSTDEENQAEDDDDSDEKNVTTTTTKKPRKPPVGGFSLLLNGNPDAEPDEEEPNPFGFEEVSLSLIPAVKYEVKHLPEWFTATVQLSYPITMFFEKLDFPEDDDNSTSSSSSPFPFDRKQFFHAHLFKQKSFKTQQYQYDKSHGRGGRESRSIMSLPPVNSLRGGERVYLLPKLENLLRSSGINARACLLRTVCEIHQNEVYKSYGFFGELLTLVFSISRSSFSKSHLPRYLEAEEFGRNGNCSIYSTRCQYSFFDFDMEQQQECEVGRGGDDDDGKGRNDCKLVG